MSAAAAVTSGSFGFPAFTEAEKRRLRELQAADAIGMIQRDWGRGVLSPPPAERPVLIMLQLQVLEGMWADPREWVRRALELAGGGDNGD